MTSSDIFFHHKKLNPEKLLTFGFSKHDDGYTYTTAIADGLFQMRVMIADEGSLSTKVIDTSCNEEYILHRVEKASGTFVGAVRAAYENVLREIAEKCFDPDVFKSDDAQKIIHYVRNTYHNELEFLWPRFPDNAIFRRKDSNKWYGVLLVLSRRKLGFNSDEVIDVLDLRGKVQDIALTVDGRKYFPGYHMNKKHWYSICLDGSVPMDEIFQRIDASYKLAVK